MLLLRWTLEVFFISKTLVLGSVSNFGFKATQSLQN